MVMAGNTRRSPETTVPRGTTVERFGPGESAEDLKAGFIVLTHGDHWTSRMIRFGQRLRFRGQRNKFARWNHVALVLDADGNLGEALSDGVVRTNLSKYEGTDYHLVRVECAPADREQIGAFAAAVLDSPQRTHYGWLTIASLFFTLGFGSKIMIGKVGTAICSGFASEALVRMGAIFPRPPAYMMPADLAEYFSVGAEH
jgi:hypothetical protein